MDTPHTWWTPLLQQAATGLGSGLISGTGVVFAALWKKSRGDSRVDELVKDVANMQDVQSEQAAHLAKHDDIMEIYAEDRNLLRSHERDIGRLEGAQGVQRRKP